MDDKKMNHEDGERPRIKVTDRRKFDANGTPRADHEEPAEPRDTAVPSPPTAAPVADVDAADASAGSDAEANTEAIDPETGERADGGGGTDPMPVDDTVTADPHAGDGEAAYDEPRDADQDPGISQLPRDFGAFVETMYLEAMLYLGAIADPRTGEVIEDPELAKYKIDLLIMLQEKTEGNLSENEKAQLDEAIYQLRMLYVQKTKKTSF